MNSIEIISLVFVIIWFFVILIISIKYNQAKETHNLSSTTSKKEKFDFKLKMKDGSAILFSSKKSIDKRSIKFTEDGAGIIVDTFVIPTCEITEIQIIL